MDSLAMIAVVTVTYVGPGLFSSYRAWVQVKSLDLVTPGAVLRTGDTIRVQAASWARTHVEVDCYSFKALVSIPWPCA